METNAGNNHFQFGVNGIENGHVVEIFKGFFTG